MPTKHPQHKAREIRSIGTGELVGWSIYPDQLGAIERRMQTTLTKLRAVTLTGHAGDTAIIVELLKAIGIRHPKIKI
jgi:hypothetical protein